MENNLVMRRVKQKQKERSEITEAEGKYGGSGLIAICGILPTLPSYLTTLPSSS